MSLYLQTLEEVSGWEFKPLSECIEKVDIPKKVPKNFFLEQGSVPIISQEADFINGYWNDEKDAVRIERPVVIFGDHTQVLKLIDFDFVVGADGVKVLKPRSFLDTSFLKYFLEANPVASLGYARHFRHISSLLIPIPPPDEQQRIVAVLDQACAALDRARANAGANLKDAERVFESSVNALMHQSRRTWKTGTFGSLVGEVSTGPFGSLLHKSDYVEHGTPIINPSNIVGGAIEPDWTKTVSDEAVSRLAPYRFLTGDLVVGRRGEMGRCAPVLSQMTGWLCGTGSFIVRPRARVSSAFVAYMMRTPAIVARLVEVATGTTMQNLSNRALADMPFELPEYDEQLRLLGRIKMVESSIQGLRAHLAGKLKDIAALHQSLLQAAFSGQLS